MDVVDLQSVTIPQRDDPGLAYLAERCESCRPIGMFKSAEDKFLLCYNEFGVYVDKSGSPNIAAGIIEWEGTADSVAVHAPYIVLFNSSFIEVRRLETGHPVQIIRGHDIRCIWDGRNVISSVSLKPDESLNKVGHVHAVMGPPDSVVGGPSSATVHQVVELLPSFLFGL
ncbi:CNH domain-containing protein [Rhodocollybia butyracea]|uniref:CNH domain-containing protein n=1 Tax=Rhodocollybia butyracea TaxID=206335 RepID=A0A9P5Q4A7_9AGAR|nr:CNH domain-containing protein [Rhodocollybia butyracea]